jgi:hypothetical protein
MMHNGDYGFMGVHFGWWVFIVVLVALAFVLRSRRRR